MIYRLISYVLISIAVLVIYIIFKFDYKYDDFKDYLTLISGVSGMIFTIMGIWIAFLYPNAMSRIVAPTKLIAKDFSESKSEAKRLESIVGAVMTSALVAVGAMLITLLKVIIFHTPIYFEYRIYIKSAAISTVIFLTLIQLESIFYVVLSNVMFINDLHFKRQDRQAEEDL